MLAQAKACGYKQKQERTCVHPLRADTQVRPYVIGFCLIGKSYKVIWRRSVFVGCALRTNGGHGAPPYQTWGKV